MHLSHSLLKHPTRLHCGKGGGGRDPLAVFTSPVRRKNSKHYQKNVQDFVQGEKGGGEMMEGGVGRGQLIISLLLGPQLEFFIESLTSRRKAERFCVNLSLFLVSRFPSIPSIKFSKHKCIACCFSGG